jgi:hypothetical protein
MEMVDGKSFDEMKDKILAIVHESDIQTAKMFTQLQLSRSAIRTTIRELELLPPLSRPDWLIGYLLGVLEALK